MLVLRAVERAAGFFAAAVFAAAGFFAAADFLAASRPCERELEADFEAALSRLLRGRLRAAGFFAAGFALDAREVLRLSSRPDERELDERDDDAAAVCGLR